MGGTELERLLGEMECLMARRDQLKTAIREAKQQVKKDQEEAIARLEEELDGVRYMIHLLRARISYHRGRRASIGVSGRGPRG